MTRQTDMAAPNPELSEAWQEPHEELPVAKNPDKKDV